MSAYFDNTTFPVLEVKFSAILSAAGFAMKMPFEWHRPSSWKVDTVRIARDTRSSFIINLEVASSMAPTDSSCEFGAINLALLAGEPSGAFKPPRLRLKSGFYDKVISALEHEGLEWFRRFSTPHDALKNLRMDPNRNSNSDAFRECEQYVNNIVAEGIWKIGNGQA